MSDNKNLPALPDVLVKFTPAVIEVNFDELKAALEKQVAEQAATVVTVDNLQSAKKLAADMNKTAGLIKSTRIEYAKKAGAQISEFETSMKSLEAIVIDGRAKITEQTTRFEDETKAAALAALQAYLVEQGTAKGIRPQFQRATIDDLANLSTLTSTGKLASKPKAEVDARIAADLQLQQQTDMRLVMLENESLKAGLAAPLTQHHVELFLYAPEDVYRMRLDRLFEAELSREKQARAAAEQRAADEQRRNTEAQQRAADAEARNKLLLEQQQQKDEQHQRELEAAKANLSQQAPTVASQTGADIGAAVQAALAASNEFVIAPVMQAKTNPTRFTGDDSGALQQALQVASSAGHAEVWRKGQPAQLVAVVLTGQAAIDYRNAVKAGA